MRSEMSRGELAVFVLALYAFFVALVAATDHFPTRAALAGDNPWYVAESEALRGVPENGIDTRHFPGFAIAAALVATVTRVSDPNAILIVSMLSSIAAIFLARELWGGLAAAWFAVIDIDWVRRSLLGGAEPLFALLVFASIAEARRERWMRAAIFAALATVVRPLGVFLLIAIAVRARWQTAVAALATAAAYFALMAWRFGDPFVNFRFYRSMGLGHDPTFIPFVTIFLPHGAHPLTMRNVAKTLVWMIVTVAAIVAAIRRNAIREHPLECLFAALYLASFLALPAWWIESEYPRYVAPLVPLMLVALKPWLPSNRVVMWIGGTACVSVAALR